jgi:hypothetical protein
MADTWTEPAFTDTVDPGVPRSGESLTVGFVPAGREAGLMSA